MKLEFYINGVISLIDLDKLAAEHAGIINIGQKCKQVWNAVKIDDESVDPFQCNIIGSAGSYKLNHGQERTECPKGLLSSRLVPCNTCTGRCVNIRAGRPKYYQRTPETPTLVNGEPVSEWGTELHEGDTITLGKVTLRVNS
jgi:hypothetical protein